MSAPSEAFLAWRAAWIAALRPTHGGGKNLSMELSSWEAAHSTLSDGGTFRVTVRQVDWIPAVTLPTQGRNWVLVGGSWKSSYNPVAVASQIATGAIPSAPLNHGEFVIAYRFNVVDRAVAFGKWLFIVALRLGFLFLVIVVMAWLYTNLPWGVIARALMAFLAGAGRVIRDGSASFAQFVLTAMAGNTAHAAARAPNQRPVELTGDQIKGD